MIVYDYMCSSNTHAPSVFPIGTGLNCSAGMCSSQTFVIWSHIRSLWGKSCLPSESENSCDWGWKRGRLTDSGDGQSTQRSLTGRGTAGNVGERCSVCRHNGKFSSARKFWSSVLHRLASGFVACVARGIPKIASITAWDRGLLRRQDEPGVGLYVCSSKCFALLFSFLASTCTPPLHSLVQQVSVELELLKRMDFELNETG